MSDPDDPRQAQALAALASVLDPELGENLVDLGLVYGVAFEGDRLRVRITMTSPGCPLGGYLVGEAQAALVSAFPELVGVEVELVWEPAWGPERMRPAARRRLGHPDSGDPQGGGMEV